MTNAQHSRPTVTWHQATVAGAATSFAEIGSGKPVVFLHGWGVSSHAYANALRQLAATGLHVYAPCLPGFGGTVPLRNEDVSIAGYARWVRQFCHAAGVAEPPIVVGHSFGGAIAIRLAYDTPDRVSHLVLINPLGGFRPAKRHASHEPVHERSLWEWCRHLAAETCSGHRPATLTAVLHSALPGLLRNPVAIYRTGQVARAVDLSTELAALRDLDVDISVTWSDGDSLLPESTFANLRQALGNPPSMSVPGPHGWLIDEPHLFTQVVLQALHLAPTPQRAAA
ncbi:alpha/beta hydrolase [Haloechinothrix sp. LS1_15]|uniref:alpha/beta fold hydrolase n=1 Tax=Haloechinothrix sp. LS1_15 TaxID=2652248 RepID=UPI0029447359|nr:alpha/beta hydrolase [Haloechinothrix sp. LS1_15]MDV6013798.1 alpha/beta hydrolase [Haloechinothrix sp. LS1_15]